MLCRSARALLERSRATACGDRTRGMSSHSRTHYTKTSTEVSSHLRLVLMQAVERPALLRRRLVTIPVSVAQLGSRWIACHHQGAGGQQLAHRQHPQGLPSTRSLLQHPVVDSRAVCAVSPIDALHCGSAECRVHPPADVLAHSTCSSIASTAALAGACVVVCLPVPRCMAARRRSSKTQPPTPR